MSDERENQIQLEEFIQSETDSSDPDEPTEALSMTDQQDPDQEPDDLDNPPEDFQSALDRLEGLARELESGELPLEEAMEAYREGQSLLTYCQQRLEKAEMVVEEVQADQGEPTLSSKDPEES